MWGLTVEESANFGSFGRFLAISEIVHFVLIGLFTWGTHQSWNYFYSCCRSKDGDFGSFGQFLAISEIVHLEQFGLFYLGDSLKLELFLYMLTEQSWRFWLFWAIFGYFRKCTLTTIWTFLLWGLTRVGITSLHVNRAKLGILGILAILGDFWLFPKLYT